ncbi:hypothetical protein quinque_001784 [Culex quinquefasciatus]
MIQIATPIAQWLGASNSCINPILYAFFNKKYRKGFAAIIRSRKCCGRLRYYDTVAIASSSTSTRKSSHYHNSTKQRSQYSPSMKTADAVSYIYEDRARRHHAGISKQDSNLSRHMLLKQDSSISRQTLLLKQDSIASRSGTQDTQISYIEHTPGSGSKKFSASLSSQDSVLSSIEHKRHKLVKQDSIFSFNEPKSVYESSASPIAAAVATRTGATSWSSSTPVISFADQRRGGNLTKQDSVTTIHRTNSNGDGRVHIVHPQEDRLAVQFGFADKEKYWLFRRISKKSAVFVAYT